MAVTKPKLLTMKVSPHEKIKWQQIAKDRGVTLAELIRTLLDGLPAPRKKRSTQYITADPRLLRELNAIGNNLNQISRRVNEGQKFDVVVELHSIEEQLTRLLNAHQVH